VRRVIGNISFSEAKFCGNWQRLPSELETTQHFANRTTTAERRVRRQRARPSEICYQRDRIVLIFDSMRFSHISFRVLAIAQSLGIAACSVIQIPTSSPQPSPSAADPSTPARETADSTPNATAPNAITQTARLIPTEPLSPTPIRIRVADLPQPYATGSASRSPNVISVPANPRLQVPQGFTVNLFADGLDRPRWLALTPDGDVLVRARATRLHLCHLIQPIDRSDITKILSRAF
jgi:hypothetical protein